MVKWIRDFLLKRKLSGVVRRIQVHNLSTAGKALLLYDATNTEAERKCRDFARFLKEEGIKVYSLGFFNRRRKKVKKPQDELNYLYFDRDDLNWLKQPKVNKILKHLEIEYDLLIDLNVQNHFSLQYLCSLSQANFKVGATGGYRDQICDLTLSIQACDLDELIEQIKVYLNMINKRA